MLKSIMSLTAVALLAICSSVSLHAQEYKIVWSHYAGWEPWHYAQESGLLAKHAAKHGVKLKLELINDYAESINRYTSDKNVVGVTITQLDALIGPCVGGVDSEVIVIGDYSNGNDAIVLKNAQDIREIIGTPIFLVENTVSHFMLYRNLGMLTPPIPIQKIKTLNVSDAEIASVFAAAKGKAACVTWNPPLLTARQVKGAKVVFDSSKIPGEILDLLVVRTDAPEAVKKALTATWYEVMAIMYGQGSKTDEALNSMAKSAGGTRAEYESQLKTTFMFNEPAAAVAFAKKPELKQTMDYVRTFCFERGLYGNAGSKDYVGIEFPDKSVLGSKRNVKLRFNTKYMEEAAAGKL